MSSGIILILAVLILGGVIATVGDRIGTRVGKARLSLFNLRPRRTATLITILTGIAVAASTLGILFAASGSLRTGVFELNRIQRGLRNARQALQQATEQKAQVEGELTKARSDQATAQQQLAVTNQSLQAATLARSRAQAATSRKQEELSRTQNQLRGVLQQTLSLRKEITQLQTDRDRVIAQREQEISARDRVIQQREARLQELESQQEFLTREVQKLELEAQVLRQGNVAIQRGQVLASAVVRIETPSAARKAVDQLLVEANRSALRLTRPGAPNQKIIQITQVEAERLINQIANGRDYVVRIFAAANYLVGETPIQVFSVAIRNQPIFQAGEVVASISLDPSMMTGEQIQQRVNLLLAAANFRARSLGILTDSVQIARLPELITFIDQLRQYKQPVEVRVVATNVTYTAGPLLVDLVTAQNDQPLPRSQPPINPSTNPIN